MIDHDYNIQTVYLLLVYICDFFILYLFIYSIFIQQVCTEILRHIFGHFLRLFYEGHLKVQVQTAIPHQILLPLCILSSTTCIPPHLLVLDAVSENLIFWGSKFEML